MAVHDEASQRLFVEEALSAGRSLVCTADQANYLKNVLRMRSGDGVLVFNGRDGEWRTTLNEAGKRGVTLAVDTQTRAQTAGPDIDYLFAPLKRARLDYMVQKAAELGVARLRPVLTRYTVAERVNGERMRANAIEAAEQCGILHVPDVDEPVKFAALLDGWDPARRLIFCDEGAAVRDPVAALQAVAPGPIAVLIGPEGGFAPEERERLLAQSYVVPVSLGPRVMRADTAAVAALTLVNAVLGDWRGEW
jgi:16S rRNA (uracil1498-N3)-methyltransferase